MAFLVFAITAPTASAQECSTGSASLLYSGEEQCYLVPAGISSVSVVAVGAPAPPAAAAN